MDSEKNLLVANASLLEKPETSIVFHRIFIFYASLLGDSNNYQYISPQKFLRLLGDCGCLFEEKPLIKMEPSQKPKLLLRRCDASILVTELQTNVGKITFEPFITLLGVVASLLYPSFECRLQCTSHFYCERLLPLHDELCNTTCLGIDKQIFDTDAEAYVKVIVEKYGEYVIILYRRYFAASEMSKALSFEQIKLSSLKSLRTLLREFSLCPDIIKIFYAILWFDRLIGGKPSCSIESIQNAGQLFTLYHFIEYLARVALLIEKSTSELEKLKGIEKIFRRIEICDSFQSGLFSNSKNNDSKQDGMTNKRRLPLLKLDHVSGEYSTKEVVSARSSRVKKDFGLLSSARNKGPDVTENILRDIFMKKSNPRTKLITIDGLVSIVVGLLAPMENLCPENLEREIEHITKEVTGKVSEKSINLTFKEFVLIMSKLFLSPV
eukprot:TRINITY_DN4514_c0_g1_i4.p1 TRINITY_DN4514_c0_g1~~TRINITY_DN4514_c0_g1_i4.p1  ORF type:complete len:438 (-),score=38.01 TRINITY_DN4514_c0_g1_i4:186-1499(-)